MNVVSETLAEKMNLNLDLNNTARGYGYGFSDEDNDNDILGHQVLLDILGTDIDLSTIVYVFPDDDAT